MTSIIYKAPQRAGTITVGSGYVLKSRGRLGGMGSDDFTLVERQASIDKWREDVFRAQQEDKERALQIADEERAMVQRETERIQALSAAQYAADQSAKANEALLAAGGLTARRTIYGVSTVAVIALGAWAVVKLFQAKPRRRMSRSRRTRRVSSRTPTVMRRTIS